MAGVRGQGRRFDTQAALDDAMEVFWRHGYEGTSISDLTRAIGITASSLYAAFEGKRQLFDQVVERYLNTKGRFTSLALEEEKDSLSLIHRLLFEAANEYADRSGPGGCLIVSAATCVTDANRDVEEKLEAHRHSNIRRIEGVLRTDLEAGRISEAVDPVAVAGFVGTVLQGMAQRGRDGASADELRSTAEMTFAQVEQTLQLP
ncbi:TetR/AcrR family transcriptional regulator [Micrococcus luteus]|uniref:TetR/AcrR family transcriptional regulator n=1 Tax=Micrococcus luteus TaxID=1270 RepID=UPI0033F8329F